jgi:hypothetical protein
VTRNLASLAIVLLASAVCRAQEWEPIFNGKDLTGWEGSAHWSAKDGIISGTITKDTLIKTNTFLIWKAGTVANFELKCKFRMEGGNSGIQYRSVHLSKDKADPYIVKGYQADMAVSSFTGILYEERGRGIIAQVGQKVVIDRKGKKEVVGSLGDNILRDFDITKWHEYRIVAKGNHLEQYIDGKQTIDVVDHDEKGRAMEGIVALQIHVGGPMLVQFKELELKRLPAGGIIDP